MDTPIWFLIDPRLHFEWQRRSTSASAHRRCLGMVPEPGRSFRTRFAQAFRTWSLHDLFGGRTAWFDSALEFILPFSTSAMGTPSDPSTSKFSRRLYIEATQILRRAQPEGVLLCSDRSPPRSYRSSFGIQLSESLFFPNIPRHQLSRAVGKAIPPDKPHPLLLHVAERDRGEPQLG